MEQGTPVRWCLVVSAGQQVRSWGWETIESIIGKEVEGDKDGCFLRLINCFPGGCGG